MKNNIRIFKTMFLVLFSVFFFNISNSQIPNWDFEQWTSHSKDAPSNWTTYGSTQKVSPGASGQYAVKIQAETNNPGAVLYGTPGNGNNFSGGVPFAARPDSLIVYAKYSIAPGDSGWVLIFMMKNGTPIASELYLNYGTYTTNFKRMAYKIHYQSSATPDSIVVGFTSTTPNNNSWNLNSYVIIDNVSFSGTTTNVPNPDFENWTTVSYDSPDGWMTDNDYNRTTAVKTTDKYAGNYALKLQTVINGPDTFSGQMQTTRPGNNNWNWGPSFPVSIKPDSFMFFAKFIPQNNDTANISVNFFNHGTSIGGGNLFITGTYNTFTPFSIPLYFMGSQLPDSASINLSAYANNYPNSNPRGASVLYIDNMSFNNFIHSGIHETIPESNELLIYPNPSKDFIHVKINSGLNSLSTITIRDYTSKEMMNVQIQNGVCDYLINISTLPCGNYFVQYNKVIRRIIIE